MGGTCLAALLLVRVQYSACKGDLSTSHYRSGGRLPWQRRAWLGCAKDGMARGKRFKERQGMGKMPATTWAKMEACQEVDRA